MKFVLICTEGDVTEPECIRAIDAAIRGQVPQINGISIEVIPIPIGGNQGHAKLVERSNKLIKSILKDSNQTVSLAGDDDVIEKWLVCDYDEIDTSKICLSELQNQAIKSGYRLILSKPNFEYFVLTLLVGFDEAKNIKKAHYIKAINAAIVKLNDKNKSEKDFGKNLMLPPYSKKRYQAKKLFSQLFHYNPELLYSIPGIRIGDNNSYTEMPILVAELIAVYGVK